MPGLATRRPSRPGLSGRWTRERATKRFRFRVSLPTQMVIPTSISTARQDRLKFTSGLETLRRTDLIHRNIRILLQWTTSPGSGAGTSSSSGPCSGSEAIWLRMSTMWRGPSNSASSRPHSRTVPISPILAMPLPVSCWERFSLHFGKSRLPCRLSVTRCGLSTWMTQSN